MAQPITKRRQLLFEIRHLSNIWSDDEHIELARGLV